MSPCVIRSRLASSGRSRDRLFDQDQRACGRACGRYEILVQQVGLDLGDLRRCQITVYQDFGHGSIERVSCSAAAIPGGGTKAGNGVATVPEDADHIVAFNQPPRADTAGVVTRDRRNKGPVGIVGRKGRQE